MLLSSVVDLLSFQGLIETMSELIAIVDLVSIKRSHALLVLLLLPALRFTAGGKLRFEHS